MQNKILNIICAVALSFGVLTGCGYTTRSTLPSRFKTIHIEAIKNSIVYSAEGGRNIYFPLLEVKVRNAITDRFLLDGNLKIADSGEADLVLKGELKSYERVALRYTDNNDVQEYRVRITASFKFWDEQKQVAFFDEPSFSGEATYFVTGSQAKTEEAAINDAALDLARRIVERAIENW
jgi:outer membrane lipopolysaccharide assembly protein LptE/RlpB